jgi:hypothetical protein
LLPSDSYAPGRRCPRSSDTGQDALPAAIVSIQTAGEFLNWHPHLHVLTIAGAFRFDGTFVPSATFDVATLRELFRADVLRLLVTEGMISGEFVGRMNTLRHSGFHAFAGEEIPEIDDAVRVGLYMVRGPATTSRLRADPAQEPKVRSLAKGTIPDRGEGTVSSGHRDYDYLEWIARLTSHIPTGEPSSFITTGLDAHFEEGPGDLRSRG